MEQPDNFLSPQSPTDSLLSPLQYLKGVGPARAELLAKLDLHTVADLLYYLPRDMLDFTQLMEIDELKEGVNCSVYGELVDRDSRVIKGNRTMTAVLIKGRHGYLRGVWFNQPYILKKYQPGDRLIFSGKPQFRDKRWEIGHPQVQVLGEDHEATAAGMLPVYGLTEGLKQHDLRRMVRTAVGEYSELVCDPLPEPYRLSMGWPRLATALASVHFPRDAAEYRLARQRLVFDDLLEFQLGLGLKRRARNRSGRSVPFECSTKIDARIRRLFPYPFTSGQNGAISDITTDLAQTIPMHRLLQADVGAGKTAIAVYALLVAVANRTQAVLMAPTELLATQHWQTIDSLLKESRVERRLLTGQLTAAQRTRTLQEIADGTAQLIIGTQALIQDGVRFSNLGLTVIDEQHRFGVMQRSRFSVGGNSPHVLVMTATPIPRSLCLTQFGDLDLTTMTDLPPGRQRVVTSRIPGESARTRMWSFLKEKLNEGRQLYVVCPRVGDGDADDTASAEVVFQELCRSHLKGRTVGLVHGRQDKMVKSDVMDQFRVGDLQVLVATTVIEVGVDIPNATLMVVLEAERFGLAQLHQLRGRVGRGSRQGYCFLVSEADSPEVGRRLSALEASADGFQIAETDFELRGPGDILGSRQHGDLPLKVADLIRDKGLVNDARTAAFELIESGSFDQPEWAPMKIKVLERFQKLMDLPQSG